jgi:D-beta-D-heptose 7-phosphate kinase/D-beta-D-heptose 1-phosphate adenosyltransferase
VNFYKGVSVLTPNIREAEHLSGVKINDFPSIRKAGFALLKATGAQDVVITRGKDGMALFSQHEKEVKLIPTFAREVYDVSGAGDTVISVIILSLVAGATIEDASMLGNLAAGIEVGKRGTATVSPVEIRRLLNLL